jgi:hypothetical protein
LCSRRSMACFMKSCKCSGITLAKARRDCGFWNVPLRHRSPCSRPSKIGRRLEPCGSALRGPDFVFSTFFNLSLWKPWLPFEEGTCMIGAVRHDLFHTASVAPGGPTPLPLLTCSNSKPVAKLGLLQRESMVETRLCRDQWIGNCESRAQGASFE